MDVLDALSKRRSIRKYQSTSISKDIIEKLVDSARWAPSGNNIQPWEFIAIRDQGTLKKLADITDFGKFIANAPLCIVVFCKNTKYYLEDGSAAVENILLAATGLGLGACWVAGDKKRYADTIRTLLGAPLEYKLVALIPIGYPKDEEQPRQKRGLNEILHYERY